MPIFKMGINENSAEQRSEEKIVKKIFTCSEIEEVNSPDAAKKTITTPTNNLQHDDPAVLFSSSKKLTRYDRAQLMRIQDSPLAKEKPPCFYDARIIQLNIMKSDSDGAGYDQMLEERVKLLQQNLQTLNLQNWNPQIYQNFRNYQYSLLDPKRQFNYMMNNSTGHFPSLNVSSPPVMLQNQQQDMQSNSKRVSFDVADQQQATLNRILPYDRKTHFFDTLTTTTMMRPPPQNDMNAFQPPRRHNQNVNNSFTGNKRVSFDNTMKKNFVGSYLPANTDQRYASSMYSRPGFFAPNNDQKSSKNEARSDEKAFNNFSQNSTAKNDNNNNGKAADNDEGEPEWFSYPASRHDFVDLHGFNEDEEAALKSLQSQVKKNNAENHNGNRFNGKKNQHSVSLDGGAASNYHNNNGVNNRYRPNDSAQMYQSPRHNNQFFNRNANPNNSNNNNNQKFRNPLHQTNKSLSPKTPTLPPATTNAFAHHQYPTFQPMNPFYEAWKADTTLNQGNVNFANLMQQANARQAPPTMKMMSEIEQGIIQNSQLPAQHRNIGGGNIHQFFQNFSGGSNTNQQHQGMNPFNMMQQQQQRVPETFTFPTVEQLQQHTSEILRNAILRNREQQYHDENNKQ